MQIKGKYSWAKHLDFLVVDLVSLLISFFIGYLVKFHTLSTTTEWRRFVVIIILIDIVIHLIGNPYSGIFRRRYYYEVGRTFVLVGSNMLLAALIFYALKIGAEYSRVLVLNVYVLYFFVSLVLKYVWKKMLTSGRISVHGIGKVSLFLISHEDAAEKDIHSIYSTDLSLYDIKGVHLIRLRRDDEPRNTLTYQDYKGKHDIPVVGDDFVTFILENNIDELFVAVKPEEVGTDVLQTLIDNGVGVNVVVESMIGFKTEEQFVTNIGVNKALRMGMFSFSPSQSFYMFVKRLFDVLCGLMGIVVLIPVTLGVKIAYLLSGDTEKIFYRQKRVGQNGKMIRIWKYRSMVPNADELLQKLLQEESYRKEWEENQKFENDPRITKVGEVLRRTSIDELPQLINVLLGDMSLVGPRPLVEGELSAHNGSKLYEKAKPGITGWWGCNGRSNIDYQERLELEYYYVKNCSLYLDITCIIRTVFAVLKKDGAQ